jgi:hypothetical protein
MNFAAPDRAGITDYRSAVVVIEVDFRNHSVMSGKGCHSDPAGKRGKQSLHLSAEIASGTGI